MGAGSGIGGRRIILIASVTVQDLDCVLARCTDAELTARPVTDAAEGAGPFCTWLEAVGLIGVGGRGG